ncbi:MAG: hypothetical protein N3D18_02425 [Roseococcus sp.]|nr:hypothetical protein [Roseococcus sp.]
MRKLLLSALLAASLGTTACTDPYGRVDPVATGLLGAGIGALAGAAIVAAHQPRHHRWDYGRPVHHRPYYAWGHPRPRYW